LEQDCNAAINIYKNFRRLSTLGNVPEEFQRTTVLGKIWRRFPGMDIK
jgi:hypothetical protein